MNVSKWRGLNRDLERGSRLNWFLLFRGVYLILQSFDYLTFSAALRSPHRKKIQSILFLLLLLNLNFLPALFSKSTEIYFLCCLNWLFYSFNFRIRFFSFCLSYFFGWFKHYTIFPKPPNTSELGSSAFA